MKKETIVAMVMGVVMLGLILGLCAGMMTFFLHLLHFHFSSTSSALLFFVLYFAADALVIGLLERVVKVAANMTQMPNMLYRTLHAAVSISIKVVILRLIDGWMDSITMPFETAVLFSVLLYLFEQVLEALGAQKKE